MADSDIRFDMLDYPCAWEIQRRVGPTLEHHPRCSSVPGWDPISGPSFLCDCGAIVKEWERMRSEALNQQDANNRETCICGVPGCHKIPPNDAGGCA